MWLAPAFSLVANTAARIYYRLTVAGERVPSRGPVLLVANHPNSLLDPLLVCAAARRPVRFLAKAPLFTDRKTGWMVRAVSAIPLYRRQDDPAQMGRNTDAFSAAFDALGRGSAVGIFPEGKSHSEPSIVAHKTGAARIALGARAASGTRVPIVPVGLVFYDKATFRSAALVVVGAPVPWDGAEDRGAEDPEAVRELTERIDEALRQVTLNLDRWEDRPLVETAVAIWDAEWQSNPDRAARVQRLEATTRILADLRSEPDPAGEALVRDVRAHRRRLARLGLSPGWLGARADLATGLRWAVSWYLVVMPIAVLLGVAGFLFFFPPYRLTGRVVDRLRLDTDVRSTWKLLLGAAIYATWLLVLAAAMGIGLGVWAVPLTLFGAPVVGMVGLRIRERWRGAWSDARRFFLLRSRRALTAALREEQRALAHRLKALYQERAAPAAI